MKKLHYLLGSDPELMLRNKQTKELCSAIPIIPEGKTNPRKLEKKGDNAVQHDNVLIEFNTTPAEGKDFFVKNVGSVLKTIDEIVAAAGAELVLRASAEFPEAELEHPDARVFGCDIDYNAWTLGPNIIDAEAPFRPFRSAGGHLHVGGHADSPELKEVLDDPYGKLRVVKALDIFVGIPSIFLDKDPTSAARRQLYGGAGAHRPKDYGVEYRATSAWWLNSPKHTELVYDLCSAALSTCLKEEDLDNLVESCGGTEKIIEIINSSLTTEAKRVYEEILTPLLSKEVIAQAAVINHQTADFRTAWQLDASA